MLDALPPARLPDHRHPQSNNQVLPQNLVNKLFPGNNMGFLFFLLFWGAEEGAGMPLKGLNAETCSSIGPMSTLHKNAITENSATLLPAVCC